MKINRLNIGEEVRRKVEESGLSKAKFAELLGIARQNIEKTVFQKHSRDTDLLCNISEVLNCNFFDYYKSDGLCNNSDYTVQKEIKKKRISKPDINRNESYTPLTVNGRTQN